MISLKNLSFRFSNDSEPVLTRINLKYGDGEFALICGPTGSGKSTLLKTINGLAPHFTGGTLGGSITLDGIDVTGWAPHQLAEQVGYVNQQPEGAFVAETVDQEIAYSLEQLGKPQDFMFSRVSELAQLMGIEKLLKQRLTSLSGGQQQRVAIASAIAAGAKTLLLDEPTSALDIAATLDIVATLESLTKTHNISVLLAEHRIEKLLEIADTLTVVHGDGTATQGPLQGENLDLLFNNHRMVPTVVELSHFCGWQPTAISVSDARSRWLAKPLAQRANEPTPEVREPAEPSIRVENLTVGFGSANEPAGQKALADFTFDFLPGQITAIMGPNGSGKTTLLWALVAELESDAVRTGQISPDFKKVRAAARLSEIALVPQRAADLLFLNSVSEELDESDRLSNLSQGTTAAILQQIAGRLDPRVHPRDLSAGQQLALVIALQMSKGAQILLLDEPTRGLDYVAKRGLADQLEALKGSGKTIIVASHDVEFVASLAERVVVLSDGRVSAQGSATEILGAPGVLQSAVAAIVGSNGGDANVGSNATPINLAQLERRFVGGAK
ncbi:MAG: hypothetical protein RL196_400 [Actinomycetota bacterium]